MKHFGFNKQQRLVKNEEFTRVFACRQRYSDGLLTLYTAENEKARRRLGISVGKRMGNAVTRNRLKRLLREVWRLSQHEIPDNYDYILIFSPNLSKKNNKGRVRIEFEQVKLSFERLIRRFEKRTGS